MEEFTKAFAKLEHVMTIQQRILDLVRCRMEIVLSGSIYESLYKVVDISLGSGVYTTFDVLALAR